MSPLLQRLGIEPPIFLAPTAGEAACAPLVAHIVEALAAGWQHPG